MRFIMKQQNLFLKVDKEVLTKLPDNNQTILSLNINFQHNDAQTELTSHTKKGQGCHSDEKSTPNDNCFSKSPCIMSWKTK